MPSRKPLGLARRAIANWADLVESRSGAWGADRALGNNRITASQPLSVGRQPVALKDGGRVQRSVSQTGPGRHQPAVRTRGPLAAVRPLGLRCESACETRGCSVCEPLAPAGSLRAAGLRVGGAVVFVAVRSRSSLRSRRAKAKCMCSQPPSRAPPGPISRR